MVGPDAILFFLPSEEITAAFSLGSNRKLEEMIQKRRLQHWHYCISF
jgi:hypothetical protein